MILIKNGSLLKALSRDKAVPDNEVDIISERFVTKNKIEVEKYHFEVKKLHFDCALCAMSERQYSSICHVMTRSHTLIKK